MARALLLLSALCLLVLPSNVSSLELSAWPDCEQRYPVGQLDGQDVFLRIMQCKQKSTDSVCENPYQSRVTLQVKQKDGNTKCVFFSSDDPSDEGRQWRTKDGWQKLYVTPLEPQLKEIQTQCADGLTFSFYSVCDKNGQPYHFERGVAIEDGKILCHAYAVYSSKSLCFEEATGIMTEETPAVEAEVGGSKLVSQLSQCQIPEEEQPQTETTELSLSNECEKRYQVGQTNGHAVMMRSDSCQPRSIDTACNKAYGTLLTLEVKEEDGRTECIFLTSDDQNDIGTLRTYSTGFSLTYNSPLNEEPSDIQAQCQDGMTFTGNYICDSSVLSPTIVSAIFFKDNKYVCHSQITLRSWFYCNGPTGLATNEVSTPKAQEQASDQICESRAALSFESPHSLFFNKCRQRSVDTLCSTDTSAVATLELNKDEKVDCVFLSDDVEFNQGDLEKSENGYTVTYDIPSNDHLQDPFAHCEAPPTFTQKFECNLLFDGSLLQTNFFDSEGNLACFMDVTIGSQDACAQTLQEKIEKLTTTTTERVSPLKYAFAQYEVKLRASAQDKLNKYWEYLKNNKWFYFIVMAVLGVFYLLFGLKMFKITIFLFGMISISLFALMISFGLIVADDSQTWVGWIIFGVGVVLGILFGILLVKCVKIGLFLLGGWPGAVCGLLLYNLFLHYIAGNVLLWIVVAILFILGGLLALWLEDHAIIIATAILGSYLLVRGCSLVIGGYPNEFTVYSKVKAGNTSSFSWQFILYLIFMAAFAVLSIIWQERNLRNEDDDSKETRRKYIRMRHDDD